jgi:D-3-phosphoglycerate dehydrogenase
MTASHPVIVIPADDPPQLQGSPRLEELRRHGEVVMFTDRPGTADEKIRRVRGATCMINSRSAVKWPGEVLRQLPELRMIAVCGIGTDAIDLEACRELGIVVSNIPGRTAPVVAEHALGLLLAVAKRACLHTGRLQRGVWGGPDNVYLRGKTLGLLGAGSIAAEMARLGQAIGMNVIAWTFHPTDQRAVDLGVRFLSLDELLRQSDAVSLHLRLTEQSRGLLGRRELALLKPGAIIVNTARGAIIDMAALAEALQEGKLGGAGLDVFDIEPLPRDHAILGCENIVLTPHNADQTPEGMDMLNAGVTENVIAFLQGQPRNRVV